MVSATILEFKNLANWLAGVLGASFESYRRGATEAFQRPGILFEKPIRKPQAQAGGTEVLVKVTQAATIFATDEDENMDIEAKLQVAIGAAKFRIPIYDVDETGNITTDKVGAMRKIEFTVKDSVSQAQSEAKGLDIPIEIRYETTLQVYPGVWAPESGTQPDDQPDVALLNKITSKYSVD